MNSGVIVIKVQSDYKMEVDTVNLTSGEELGTLTVAFVDACRDSGLNKKQMQELLSVVLKNEKN